MGDHVYLISEVGEVDLGTVEEVLACNASQSTSGSGLPLDVALSDITADLLGDPTENCVILILEIR